MGPVGIKKHYAGKDHQQFNIKQISVSQGYPVVESYDSEVNREAMSCKSVTVMSEL
jgi:hypothetical protein